MQLNRYRIMVEEKGLIISRMQLQVTVRDGGLQVAEGRGITRNIYMIPVRKMDDTMVKEYFNNKTYKLLTALDKGEYSEPCNDVECWSGTRCKEYCEVAIYCNKGILYQTGGK
jgi:hypothetical protein